MNDLATLHDELLIGHPVTGSYSADAATAAEQINAVNRTRTVPISSGELLRGQLVQVLAIVLD